MKTVSMTLVFLLLGIVSPLIAEDAAYVSRLTAQPGSQSILLTWKDADSFSGAKYEVWRSLKEITKDSFSQAKLLATVDSGVEAYEDKTAATGSFYLVLLKDRSGNRKTFYIPYKNKTASAVSPGPASTSMAVVKVGLVSYASPQVVLPFDATPPDKKLLVFRRTLPITTLADLKDSTLLGPTIGASAPYRDTPPPGLDFYYAIVDAQAFADNKANTFQADNATTQSAGFPLVALPPEVQDASLDPALRPNLGSSSRTLPLPLLQVNVAPDSGVPLPASAYAPVQAQPLSAEIQAELMKFAKTSPAAVSLPDPVVLPEERAATEQGAAQYLVQIQKSYLQPKDWKGSIKALETVLRLALDSRTEARARFYLGEAWGYLKDYRRAFVEMLSARDSYPETKPFLEALFILLASTKD